MTILEAYRNGFRSLRESRVLPDDEARAAVRIALDFLVGERYAHLTSPDRVLLCGEITRWNELLDELARGRPLAHLLGEREFLGLKFCSDARALIPRPETELLVEAAAQRLQNQSAPCIADLGTGSGAIAIGVAHLLPNAQIWATDVSLDALSLARENAKTLDVENRIRFMLGQSDDWAAPLLDIELKGSFDAILTNPPYIARHEVEELPPQIRDFEPRAALDGGEDGLQCYRAIATQCAPLLAAYGFLITELGDGQFEEVRDIFIKVGWKVEAPMHDLGGVARVLVAKKP